MSKNFFIYFLLILIFVFNLNVEKIKATTDETINLYGFAWGGNPEIEKIEGKDVLKTGLGWISFNSENCDENKDGKSDGNEGCPPEGTLMSKYSVTVNKRTGKISGHAWAGGGKGSDVPTIGWIDFNPPERPDAPYPAEPKHSAQIEENGKITGWARACAATENKDCNSTTTSGGWDGWILMSGKTTDNNDFGVSVNGNNLEGWAWGSDVVGWISFNSKNCDKDNNKFIDTDCGGDNKTTTSTPYWVSYGRNPLLASDLKSSFDNGCNQSRIPTLSWKINRSDSSYKYDYKIEIDDDSNFSSPIITEQVSSTQSRSWAPKCTKCCDTDPYNKIKFGENKYYWRIKVKNSEESDFGPIWEQSDFTTKKHCFPNPNFTYSPLNPPAKTIVKFNASDSLCYDNDQKEFLCRDKHLTNYKWTFTDPDPSKNIPSQTGKEIATTSFSKSGIGRAELEIKDDIYTCTKSEDINVKKPVPNWIEIEPISWLKKIFAAIVNIFK